MAVEGTNGPSGPVRTVQLLPLRRYQGVDSNEILAELHQRYSEAVDCGDAVGGSGWGMVG